MSWSRIAALGLALPLLLTGCAPKEKPAQPSPATSGETGAKASSSPAPTPLPMPSVQPAAPMYSPSKIAAPATRAAAKAGQEQSSESTE